MLFRSGGLDNVEEYKLTDDDWAKINRLSEEKYQTWAWNYGKNPKYNYDNSHKYDAGLLDVRLEVKGGRIEHAKIFGDFFGVGEVVDIENLLIGVEHNRDAIAEAIKDIDISHYLGRITREEFLDLIS